MSRRIPPTPVAAPDPAKREANRAKVRQKMARQLARSKYDELRTYYWQAVKAQTVLFPEALSTLQSLGRRYELAAISNTQAQAGGQKHRLIETPDLTVCFDAVVVAGEGDVPAKPDRRVFLACLATLDVDPSQAVYVGDDWRADICGATDAGLQAIWIKHRLLSRTWPRPDRDISAPVITSLESLLDIDGILS